MVSIHQQPFFLIPQFLNDFTVNTEEKYVRQQYIHKR